MIFKLLALLFVLALLAQFNCKTEDPRVSAEEYILEEVETEPELVEAGEELIEAEAESDLPENANACSMYEEVYPEVDERQECESKRIQRNNCGKCGGYEMEFEEPKIIRKRAQCLIKKVQQKPRQRVVYLKKLASGCDKKVESVEQSCEKSKAEQKANAEEETTADLKLKAEEETKVNEQAEALVAEEVVEVATEETPVEIVDNKKSNKSIKKSESATSKSTNKNRKQKSKKTKKQQKSKTGNKNKA